MCHFNLVVEELLHLDCKSILCHLRLRLPLLELDIQSSVSCGIGEEFIHAIGSLDILLRCAEIFYDLLAKVLLQIGISILVEGLVDLASSRLPLIVYWHLHCLKDLVHGIALDQQDARIGDAVPESILRKECHACLSSVEPLSYIHYLTFSGIIGI